MPPPITESTVNEERADLGTKMRCVFERVSGGMIGTWLSLAEHSLGLRGVGSSNLPVPTKFPRAIDVPVSVKMH